jgi:hypothetical protein
VIETDLKKLTRIRMPRLPQSRRCDLAEEHTEQQEIFNRGFRAGFKAFRELLRARCSGTTKPKAKQPPSNYRASRPVSYYAIYWVLGGGTLLGGVKVGRSSRWDNRKDAEHYLSTVIANNGEARCAGRVVSSSRYPEIFTHCGAGPAQAIGGRCFYCRKVLTVSDAIAAAKLAEKATQASNKQGELT